MASNPLIWPEADYIPDCNDPLAPRDGMTMRDCFAGRVAAAAMVNARGITEDVADEAFPALARISYKLADAMLAARGQP